MTTCVVADGPNTDSAASATRFAKGARAFGAGWLAHGVSAFGILGAQVGKCLLQRRSIIGSQAPLGQATFDGRCFSCERAWLQLAHAATDIHTRKQFGVGTFHSQRVAGDREQFTQLRKGRFALHQVLYIAT